jgi:hypothetical protein
MGRLAAASLPARRPGSGRRRGSTRTDTSGPFLLLGCFPGGGAGAEKNYEEVYQAYRYYEAVYDAAERVVIFREYRRGEAIRTEEYRYGPDGALLERWVRQPGQPVEKTAVGPAQREGGSEAAP